jgi:GNAT superfamily N-acetyltransferase
VIRRLAENDDPSGFSCGDHELDRYLAAHALANAAAGGSVTYVLDEPGFGVAGFVTLAAASIRADAIPHLEVDLPRYPLPALLVARLAVDVGRQRRGHGGDLLAFSFEEALVARDRIGCVGVLADVKPGAKSFYERLGFVTIAESASPAPRTRMFMSISGIVDALGVR